MKYTLRKTVTKIERFLAPKLGKIFWPTTGVNIICWANSHEKEVIVLDIDGEKTFPSGMIKLGEHPEKAALREFKEETGLEINLKQFLGFETSWNGIKGIHFFYEAVLDDNFENREESWEGKPERVDKKDVKDLIQKTPKETK